jgi:hypothetical protein
MNNISHKDMETHIAILGWVYIIGNAFLLMLGGLGLFFFMGIGVMSGEMEAAGILTVIGMTGLVFFAALALPGMIAGYGLLKRKSWARILTIVLGVLNLFSFPVGTAVGVYTLWVLLQDSANDFFIMPKIA